MDPMNKQARDSLARCLKCIKQDEGIDYVPEGEDIVIKSSDPELEAEESLQQPTIANPAANQTQTTKQPVPKQTQSE